MSHIHIKVAGGTRTNEKRLCDVCSEGVVMRGRSTNEEVVFCRTMERNVGIHVVECTCFQEGGRPTLWDMRHIAWVLNQDARRQRIGFLSAAEWRRDHDEDPLDGFVE